MLTGRKDTKRSPTQGVQVREGMAWKISGINTVWTHLSSPSFSQHQHQSPSQSNNNPFSSQHHSTTSTQHPNRLQNGQDRLHHLCHRRPRRSGPRRHQLHRWPVLLRLHAPQRRQVPPLCFTLPRPDSDISPQAPTTSSGSAASPTPSPSATSPSTASTRRRRSSSAAPPTPSRTTSSASPTRSPRTAASRRRQTDADMAAARTTAALPRSRVWRVSGEGVGFGGLSLFL